MPGEGMVSEAQEQIIKKSFLRAAPANEVQTLTIDATGGTSKLSYEGQETSSSINHNASAGTYQSALESLSTIGAGNIAITGTFPNYTATFQGSLASTPVDLIRLTTNALTGGGSTITIARTTAGSGCIRQYYYVGLSTTTREALGDATTLATVNELAVSNGYARIRVKTDGIDIVISATSGFWDSTTKEVTFTASGGNWSVCNSVFLTDVPSGTTGKLWKLRTVTSFTLLDGQSQGIKLREGAADPI